MTTAKKHALKVSILNEEYAIRSDTSPEHAREVAQYLDQAIRKVLSSGSVVETNRAVVLAALQMTAELFAAKEALQANVDSVRNLSDYVRPPPATVEAEIGLIPNGRLSRFIAFSAKVA